jgi:hypothetical protein
MRTSSRHSGRSNDRAAKPAAVLPGRRVDFRNSSETSLHPPSSGRTMIPNRVEPAKALMVSATLWAAVGMAICVGNILAFAGLQYRMPEHASPLGLNAPAVVHFQGMVLGHSIGTLDLEAYRFWFRFFLWGAWAGYALVLGAGWMGGITWPRRAQGVMAVVGLLMAFFAPPSLSTDAYCYVAYARMHAYHGLNPYIWSLQALVPIGDPTAKFFGKVDSMSVYGPVWTQLCVALVVVMRSAGLWWQVTVLKVIEAVALTSAAWLGGMLATRFFPGRGQLASVSIGLNPLLLIEGPGNGHNDILMMALMLAAAVLTYRGRVVTGDLALGLSIGIKYLPITVVCWLLAERLRGKKAARSVDHVFATLVLVLAPSALAMAPLWQGLETFSGLRQRSQWGTEPQQEKGVDRWIANSGLPGPLVPWAHILLEQWPIIDGYVALTVWLGWSRIHGRWLDAWVLLSGALIGWTCVVRYPWYMTWPMMVALTRWDRRRLGVSVACLGFAVYMSFRYLS